MLSMLRMAAEWRLYESETQMDVWTALGHCATELGQMQASARWGAPALLEARASLHALAEENAGGCGPVAVQKARSLAIRSLQAALA